MSEKVYVEKIDNYLITFTIDGYFVTVQIQDLASGDGMVGYQHFFDDPTKLLENEELRKMYAETLIKMLKFFRKYHKLIGNVVEFRTIR
jgi:hypothetical protein